jgi:thioredoxin 1
MIKPMTGTAAFDEAVKTGDVIVGFSAPWCGYCRRLRPIMEKISNEVDIPFYGINVDEDKELAERYKVETIPDIFFFHDGKPMDSIIGYGTVGYKELMAFIEKNKSK